MKRIKSIFFAVFVLAVSFLQNSCSKDNEGGQGYQLPGTIYHQYTSDVMQVDMGSGSESLFFSYNSYSTVSWGLSRDGKLRIISSREPTVYDRTHFAFVNTVDGTIANEFDYVPRYGNSTRNHGALSFDKSMILIEPDNDNGIVILNVDGTVKYEISGINSEDFSSGDEVVWLPNNGLLLSFDNKLFRADPPYNNLTLVREMNYEGWGNLRVSSSGQKVSMYINNHIFMMDVDGGNLVQVTDSNGDEVFGEFSPDDKYLLVGSDYFHAPASQNSHWYLKIIPADGNKYHLDNGAEVIPLIPNGAYGIVRANKVTLWRP